MNTNATQLALPSGSDAGDAPRWAWRNRSHPPRKHRALDRVAQLERDLARAQELNEALSANLSAQIAETAAANERYGQLLARVEDLDRRLRVAEEANVANASGVDFYFQQREISGPEDQATMPVPQVELLADGPSLKAAAVDAATAMLDRLVSRPQPELTLVPSFAPEALSPNVEAPPIPPTTWVDEPEETVEETELYNAIHASWGARRPQPQPPRVSSPWSGRVSPPTALRANMSTTGTFVVTPLQQRGTGPTAVPGFAS